MYESVTMNEWRTEGREKGISEGRLEEARETLLRLARLRFQAELPPQTAAVVNTETDLRKLSHWIDLTVTARSPEEFVAAVPIQVRSNGKSKARGKTKTDGAGGA